MMRGSYRDLVKRLDEAEGRVRDVATGGPGCPTCAEWPPCAVTDEEGMSGYDAARPRWPESRRCPDCGREPRYRFRLVWGDVAPTQRTG